MNFIEQIQKTYEYLSKLMHYCQHKKVQFAFKKIIVLPIKKSSVNRLLVNSKRDSNNN